MFQVVLEGYAKASSVGGKVMLCITRYLPCAHIACFSEHPHPAMRDSRLEHNLDGTASHVCCSGPLC